MDFNLRKVARDNYKESIFASWVFAIVIAILAAGAASLGAISFLLTFVISVLFVFPIFFSFIVSHTIAREKEPITFTNQFARSLAFFRSGNIRSFKLLSSFLFSMLYYLGASIALGIICVIVFRIIRPEVFNEMMTSLTDSLIAGEEGALDDFLAEYANYVIYFEVFTTCPASVIASLFFIYRTTINSIYIYAKKILHKFDSGMIMMIHNQVFRTNGRSIRKDYFALNWPIFVLFFLFSSGVGFLIAYFIRFDPTWIASLGVAGGLLSLMFFLPFYFGNMEAIYQKYEMEYKRATIEVTKRLYDTIRERIDLNEEEKKNLEDALNRLSDNTDEDEEE
ncbi:MAG: hypothetical protein IJQ67_06170 [Bacilli bacterium]|nr:hypothetical protein [Bacilli bacterium]